jgi:tyrosyl-tRNA synthetase
MNIFPADADITPSKRVKFGIDPTFPRLHLGHFIPLRFVKKMKEAGHKVTIVLGTFTAQLGDPSGRDSTRPILSEAEVQKNAEQILHKVKELLGPDTDFFPNGWLHNSMTLPKFLRDVASKFTLSHMTSRNAFADRVENNHPIAMHELLVPMLQGMDSVHLETEIEIGGQDQLFNFQIARQLQESFGQKPQACVMFPVINGTDGRKMSKSFGNCIFLDEPANDIFGKVMSIPDSVMEEWFPLLSDTTRMFNHPMDNKKALAFDIVRQLQDRDAAKLAQEFFEKTVQQKEIPEEIPEIQAETLVQAIQKIRNCSKTVCRTLLNGKGVKINGVVCTEDRPITSGEIVQVGKRDFAKVL